MKKIKTISTVIIILFILSFILSSSAEARSGCCSWHGGVCSYSCPGGSGIGYRCCDGTSLSVKCAPYYSTCPLYIEGCTDPEALNYNTRATKDNGSCKYPEPEPQLEPKLKTEAEPEPEPQSVLEPEPEPKLESELKPEPKPEQQPEPEFKSEASPTKDTSQPKPDSETSLQKSYTAAVSDTQQKEKSYSWIWWIIAIVIIGGIAYNYGKKKNKK